MKCCICGRPIVGYGNNPFPLCDKDDYESECCDECNGMYVIPARIRLMGVPKENYEEERKKIAYCLTGKEVK